MTEAPLAETPGARWRLSRDLYAIAEERGKESHVAIRCAFIEILNEEVRDLLHPEVPSKAISIRERADGAILVSGIKEEPAGAAEDLQRLLDSGSVCRRAPSGPPPSPPPPHPPPPLTCRGGSVEVGSCHHRSSRVLRPES